MTIQPSDMKAENPAVGIARSAAGPAGSGVRINVVLPQAESNAGRWMGGLGVGIGIHAVVIGLFFYATTTSNIVLNRPPLALNIDLLPVQTSPIDEAEDQPLDLKKTNFVPTPFEPKPEEIEEPEPDIKPEVVLPKPIKKIKKKKKKIVKKVTLKKPVEKRRPEKERRTASAPVKALEVVSTAKQIGVSTEVLAAKVSWQGLIRGYLERKKRYPSNARRRHQEGIVSVSFSVDRQGNVTQMDLVKSSNHKSLDEEILALLKRASPLPAPPVDVEGDIFRFELPFAFYIKN